MIWERLKTLRCPQDNGTLIENSFGYGCTTCPFRIGKARFDEVVTELYKPKRYQRLDVERDMDNMRALNNLGTKIVARDYGGTEFDDE